MADTNSELLALMGDLIRATDRQTEENKRAIQEMGDRFERALGSLTTATVNGFARVDQRIDGLERELVGVKQEVTGLKQEMAEVKQEVKQINQRLERQEQRTDAVVEHLAHLTETTDSINRRVGHIEKDLPNYLDVLRRLTVLETIVLPKAS